MTGAHTARAAVVGGLRLITIAVLVWGAFYNLWGFATHPGSIPPPGVIDEIVVRDKQFEPIRWALIRQEYRAGFIEYKSPRNLRGEPRTDDDDYRWAKYRFAAFPLILARDAPDAAYVLGDFTEDGKIPATPEGLTLIENPGNGLVLYKRNSNP